jgi:hypothetical protein
MKPLSDVPLGHTLEILSTFGIHGSPFEGDVDKYDDSIYGEWLEEGQR